MEHDTQNFVTHNKRRWCLVWKGNSCPINRFFNIENFKPLTIALPSTLIWGLGFKSTPMSTWWLSTTSSLPLLPSSQLPRLSEVGFRYRFYPSPKLGENAGDETATFLVNIHKGLTCKSKRLKTLINNFLTNKHGLSLICSILSKHNLKATFQLDEAGLSLVPHMVRTNESLT